MRDEIACQRFFEKRQLFDHGNCGGYPQVQHLVGCVETFALDKVLFKAKGHGDIVAPLAGLHAEGAAAYHIRDWFGGTRWRKLHGGR
jgi:hypothetical protein